MLALWNNKCGFLSCPHSCALFGRLRSLTKVICWLVSADAVCHLQIRLSWSPVLQSVFGVLPLSHAPLQEHSSLWLLSRHTVRALR